MDLDKIASENEYRKTIRTEAEPGVWDSGHGDGRGNIVTSNDSSLIIEVKVPGAFYSHFKDTAAFIAFAANDNAAETIDSLLARVKKLEGEVAFRDGLITDLCQEKAAFAHGAEQMRERAASVLNDEANKMEPFAYGVDGHATTVFEMLVKYAERVRLLPNPSDCQ